jgi:hypothetical protein
LYSRKIIETLGLPGADGPMVHLDTNDGRDGRQGMILDRHAS